MKQEASFFEGKEPRLVYVAKRLKDALRLESVFNTAGLDYGVETDEYSGGVIFRKVRVGAFFYVLPEAADAALGIMRQNAFEPYADPQPPA